MADRLDAMQALIAVCDAGGFTAAGRRLQLSSSTVTRLVAALERSIGTQLLHRTTRSIRMTRAGEAYLPLARETLERAASAERAALSEQAPGGATIRVAAPLLFGRLHAGRLLATFMASHPGVRVEMFLANDYARLIEDGVDLAVRIGVLPDAGLLSRGLGETGVVLAASPDYLAGAGTPAAPAQLVRHRLIGSQGVTARHSWRFAGDDAPATLAVDPVFYSDNAEAAIALAVAGGGIVSALGYQIAPHIRVGELVEVLPAFRPATVPIQAVLPGTRFISPIVRELLDEFAAERSRWADPE